MRILVTGGAGFIGSHVVEHFQGKAKEIRVLDSLRSGYLRNLSGLDYSFIEGSVTDRNLVREAVDGVDYVFHMAALISVPESMEKPVECVEINTVGTLVLLEEASRANVKKFCLSSSAAVYGDDPAIPKTEDMPPRPLSPYAVTKLSAEYYCELFQRQGRLNTAAMRYFNVFGPRQDPASQYAAAVPIFIRRALANQPITIFGDGEQTRDFIYVEDVVEANAHLARHPELTGVYNVARGKRITINALARKILEITESRSSIQYADARAGDIRHSVAAAAKLHATGFQPKTPFDPALKATIDFFGTKPVQGQD